MRTTATLTLLALGGAFATPAAAAPFTEAGPVPGSGPGAVVAGTAFDAAGRPTLAASVLEGGRTRAALYTGAPGQVPAGRTLFGPAGAYDLDLATNAEGTAALTFSVKDRAYLAVCTLGACGPTQRIGTADGQPESVVAVQPRTGRTTVLWRGRTRSGRTRLQWRISTRGKLGRVHTLGESGVGPRIKTDDSGKTVAIWQDTKDARLRTAARRVGEFTRPGSVTSDPVQGQKLAVAADGRFLAGWLTGDGLDVQSPAGTVQTSSRTGGTSFSAPASHGEGATVDVALSPNGRGLLTVLGLAEVAPVLVATSAPDGDFGPLVRRADGGFVSSAFPPAGAIDDAANAVIAYNGQPTPGRPVEVKAIRARAGVFSPVETLSTTAELGVVGRVRVALGAGVAQVAYAGADALEVRRAPIG